MLFRRLAAVLAVATVILGPAGAAEARLDADAAFLRTAHQGNLAQIALGRIAADRGATRDVRRLGARFAADSAHLDVAVQRAARMLDVTLDSAPNGTVQQSITTYRNAPQADFDQFFVSSQAILHNRAARLVRAELRDGDETAVRQVAQRALSIVRRHRAALGNLGQ